MIPNQWYVVLDSKQVKNKPVGVTRLGEKLVFWRDENGKVACLRDYCIHRGVLLSPGKIVHGHIQCPFHGLEYDGSGRVKHIPANGKNTPVPKIFKAHSYPTHEEHGFIWVWWGDNPPENLQKPTFFNDLDDGFSYGAANELWHTHYSRVIENQLDVMHLPFVHYNTIGSGGKTLVDGPQVQWVNDNMFYFYVYNRIDDGTPPRRPRQLPPPDPARDFHLAFLFPNLWQNYISSDIRILAAFVPVDDQHTRFYLRFYQRIIRVPILRQLLNTASIPFNLRIAHQDKTVVETHQIGPSGLEIGERLVQGDLPVIEYRRKRAQLIAENTTD